MNIYKEDNDKKINEGNDLIYEFVTSGRTPEYLPKSQHLPKYYHTHWDWLMPVVERIESIHHEVHGYFGVHISSNSCSIQGTNLWRYLKELQEEPVYMSNPDAIFDTKLESTWYVVVEFIKWYNENIKPKLQS